MTAIIGYAVAGILTIILVIFAMIKYKMFAIQEPVEQEKDYQHSVKPHE